MSFTTEVPGFGGRVYIDRRAWLPQHYVVISFYLHEFFLHQLNSRQVVLDSLKKIRQLEAVAFQRAGRLDCMQKALLPLSCALLPMSCCMGCYCGTCIPCVTYPDYPKTTTDLYLRVLDPCFTCNLYEQRRPAMPNWRVMAYYLTENEREALEIAEQDFEPRPPLLWKEAVHALPRSVAPIDVKLRERDCQEQVEKLEKIARLRKTALCIASNICCPCSAIGFFFVTPQSPPQGPGDLLALACNPCIASDSRSFRVDEWLFPPERQQMKELREERNRLKPLEPLFPLFEALDGQTTLVHLVLDYAAKKEEEQRLGP